MELTNVITNAAVMGFELGDEGLNIGRERMGGSGALADDEGNVLHIQPIMTSGVSGVRRKEDVSLRW